MAHPWCLERARAALLWCLRPRNNAPEAVVAAVAAVEAAVAVPEARRLSARGAAPLRVACVACAVTEHLACAAA